MTIRTGTLDFRHHVVAMLSAAILGSLIFTLLGIAYRAFLMSPNFPGITYFSELIISFWLMSFALAMLTIGIGLSLLWPLTRRQSTASAWICIIASSCIGVLVTPYANKVPGITLSELAFCTATGAMVGTIYALIAKRFGKKAAGATILADAVIFQ
jgi:hypothetical protein